MIRSLALISLIFICGCSSSDKTEERIFLENMMIRNCGLYVLMGSKPMTTFEIDNYYPETLEEYENYYNKYYKGTEFETVFQVPLSKEEFSKIYKEDMHLHTKHLWKIWLEKMNQISPRYRFVMRKAPFARDTEEGLFINVPNLLLTLKTYYHDFAECNGGPFNPREVLDEISDIDSPFWNRMFTCNYTQGLLLGYGRKNSMNFSWQFENKLDLPRISIKEQNFDMQIKENLSVEDLQLPPICVYYLGDEVLEKYKRERDLIIKEFHGKDFEIVVKKWLVSKN